MNTPTEIQSAAIALLHFHAKWFGYEMLPLSFFEQQVQWYRKVLYFQAQGDEFWKKPGPQWDEVSIWASLEHHRYAAFNLFLDLHSPFSDEQVTHYVELCELDEDQFMAQAALINLIRHQELTSAQRQYLMAHPACQNPRVQPWVLMGLRDGEF